MTAVCFCRLVGLYRRHSSLENCKPAGRSRAAIRAGDGSVSGGAGRTRTGQPGDAAKLLEEAVQQGLDEAKAALLLSSWRRKDAARRCRSTQTARAALSRCGQAMRADGLRCGARWICRCKRGHRQGRSRAARSDEERDGDRVDPACARAGRAAGPSGKSKNHCPNIARPQKTIGRVESAVVKLRCGELEESLRDDNAAIANVSSGAETAAGWASPPARCQRAPDRLSRKRDELVPFIKQFEADHPQGSAAFPIGSYSGGCTTSGVTRRRRFGLSRCAAQDPHHIDVRRRLIAILERGGVTAEVLSEYEQLIAQAPGDSRGYLELAERQWKVGQKPKALLTLRRAAARFAADPLCTRRSRSCTRAWGSRPGAARVRAFVRLEPREESYIINLGELYWARGRKERATRCGSDC